MFSTSVTAFSASARWEPEHMSVMTPFAAGAVPDPSGRRNVATQGILGLARVKRGYGVHDIPR